MKFLDGFFVSHLVKDQMEGLPSGKVQHWPLIIFIFIIQYKLEMIKSNLLYYSCNIAHILGPLP